MIATWEGVQLFSLHPLSHSGTEREVWICHLSLSEWWFGLAGCHDYVSLIPLYEAHKEKVNTGKWLISSLWRKLKSSLFCSYTLPRTIYIYIYISTPPPPPPVKNSVLTSSVKGLDDSYIIPGKHFAIKSVDIFRSKQHQRMTHLE